MPEPVRLRLVDRDGFALDAVANALAGGTTGDIAVLRHLAGLVRDGTAPGDVLLAALGGRDPESSRIAREEVDAGPFDPDALRALATVGVDAAVALAIADVMDDCSVEVDDGPARGASIAWWQGGINVWTPPVMRTAWGSSGIAVCTDGTLSFNATLPDTACAALAGRPVRDLNDHPLLPLDRLVEEVRCVAGTTTVRLAPPAGP